MYRNLPGCLLLIVVFTTSSSAQFSKGMRMAGSTIGSGFFNAGKYEYSFPSPTNGYTANNNSFNIHLSPNFGWFISDHTVISIRLSAGYTYEKNIDASNNVTFRKKENEKMLIGLGGFARNYFSSSGSFIPFGQAHLDAGLGSSSTEGFAYTTVYRESYKGKSSGDFFADAGLSFGVTKMLNPHVGLDIFAGYTFFYNKNTFKTTTYRDVDIDGSIDETNIENPATKFTNHGFTFGVGLQVFLGKK